MIATVPAAVKHKAPEIERKITSSETAPENTKIQAKRMTFAREKPSRCSGGVGAAIRFLILLRQLLFLEPGGEGDSKQIHKPGNDAED